MFGITRNIAVRFSLPIALLAIGRAEADQSSEGPRSGMDKADISPLEKTYRFDLGGRSWSEVFQWFNDHSDKEVIGFIKPQGLFLFAPRPCKSRYSLEEISDLINDALLKQDLVMVYGPRQWILIPTNEFYDDFRRPPTVPPDRLWRKNKYEPVSTRIPVANLKAEDLELFEKWPLARGFYFEERKEFWIAGTAGRVHDVCNKIQNMDAAQKHKAESK